jgi:hypothetical protein
MEQVSGFYFPPSGETSSGFLEMEEISVSGFNILVRAKRDGKWWVLKALAPDVRHNEVFRNLLHKEYDILSKIQHPGVAFNQPVANGTSYEYKGKTYYICDPTYIGARIGRCMPSYAKESPQIEVWY